MTKKTTLKELGEMLEYVVKHMATKADIAELKTTLDEHSKILADHTRDVAGLSAKIDRIDTKLTKFEEFDPKRSRTIM